MAHPGSGQDLAEAVVDQVDLYQERRAAERKGKDIGRNREHATAGKPGKRHEGADDQTEDARHRRQKQRQRGCFDERRQEADNVGDRFHQWCPRLRPRSIWAITSTDTSVIARNRMAVSP
ncbi:hypothetical protein D9M70_505530 [compost metagenome]